MHAVCQALGCSRSKGDIIFCPHSDYSGVGMSGSKEQITVNCDKLCDRASTGRGIQKGQYLKKALEGVWFSEAGRPRRS